MTDVLEEHDYRGYTIEVIPDIVDHDFIDPRNNDNVGTMVCSHREYDLGDEQLSRDQSLLEYMADLCTLNIDEMFDRGEDWLEAYDVEIIDSDIRDKIAKIVRAEFEKNYISLPLFLHDHGNITMSCSSFSCPWDSGEVGIIYAPRGFEEMDDEQIEKCLHAEVEEYGEYIAGHVYGFNILDPDSHEIDDGSMWGYIGLDFEKSGLLEDARECIDREIEHRQADALQKRRQRDTRLKALIRHHVPLGKRTTILAHY